jgi:hypothetical protein
VASDLEVFQRPDLGIPGGASRIGTPVWDLCCLSPSRQSENAYSQLAITGEEIQLVSRSGLQQWLDVGIAVSGC